MLAAVGALLMVLRRKASVITRQLGLLALATRCCSRYFGSAVPWPSRTGRSGPSYKALCCSLLPCAGYAALSGRENHARFVYSAWLAAGLAAVLVNTSYLLGAVLWRQTSVNLANSGAAFEHFYITAPELASAQWLGDVVAWTAGLRRRIRPASAGRSDWDATRAIPRSDPDDPQSACMGVRQPHNVINGRALALYKDHPCYLCLSCWFLSMPTTTLCIHEWLFGGVPSVISIVIISKDEESLDDTLTDVAASLTALEESSEIVVVDASDGRLDHVRHAPRE